MCCDTEESIITWSKEKKLYFITMITLGLGYRVGVRVRVSYHASATEEGQPYGTTEIAAANASRKGHRLQLHLRDTLLLKSSRPSEP